MRMATGSELSEVETAPHLQPLPVFSHLAGARPNPQVTHRLVRIEVIAAVEDFAGQLRALEGLPIQEQRPDLVDAVRGALDGLVALDAAPKLLVVEGDAFVGRATVDHGADRARADGDGFLELRGRPVEPEGVWVLRQG